MKILIIMIATLVLCSTSVVAQEADTTNAGWQESAPEQKEKSPSKFYFGGNVGLNFGDYFRIRIAPLVGYRLTAKASAGVKIAYEYIEDKRYSETVTSHNYGGSFFTRYRFHPKGYAQVEFAAMSYQYKVSEAESDREWIPFILVGGGFMQRIAGNSWAFIEVMFDVLQDDKSPYKDWEPWVSVGAGVGF